MIVAAVIFSCGEWKNRKNSEITRRTSGKTIALRNTQRNAGNRRFIFGVVRCVCSASFSITERNVDIARGLHQLAVRRDKLEPIDCFGNRHVTHLIVLVTHHRPEMPLVR